MSVYERSNRGEYPEFKLSARERASQAVMDAKDNMRHCEEKMMLIRKSIKTAEAKGNEVWRLSAIEDFVKQASELEAYQKEVEEAVAEYDVISPITWAEENAPRSWVSVDAYGNDDAGEE